MATYHCSFRHGSVGRGVPHANYICREGKYGSVRMKEQLVYQESGNLPEFAKKNPLDYWKAADEFTRVNGRAYEEIEVALPQELSHEENIALVKSFIASELGTEHAYTFAIHDKPAANDPAQRQVHAHIMFSPKVQDGIERPREQFFKRYNAKAPERGGARNDTRFSGTHGKEALLALRKQWELAVNRAYEERGMEQRVSAQSLSDQRAAALAKGDQEKAFVLDRIPQEHMGPKITYTTLREAAKAPDKEKFYLEKAHPKARRYFVAMQQKKLAQEIVALRRERILTLRENLENKRNIQELHTAISDTLLAAPTMEEKAEAAKQIGMDLRAQLTLAKQELKAAQAELRAFRNTKDNYLLSEKKIAQIANDVYTKGETKRLRARAANCKRLKTSIERMQAEIASGKLTEAKVAELTAKIKDHQKHYRKEAAGLPEAIAKMQARLVSEKAQAATSEIADAIRQRVEIARQRIADRQQRIDNLRAQSFVLQETHASLQDVRRFTQEQERLWARVRTHAAEVERIQLIDDPKEKLRFIHAKQVELHYQKQGIMTRSQRLNRFHAREDFARNAATNVYTHGRYRRTYLAQVKETKRLAQELKAAPTSWELREAVMASLAKEKQLRQQFEKELATPAAQRSIERMVAARMEKNYVLESRQTIMAETVAAMDDLEKELRSMEDAAAKDLEKQRAQARANQKEQSLSQALRAMLNIPEARSTGGLTASLRDYGNQNVKDRALKNSYEYDFD